ncbi:MAG: dual specificity protein phosphatase family protein [Burkholderiales bacterium]
MQHIFWLEPDILAGRTGPNREPWNISELRNAGIGAVLSVNDGELRLAEDFAELGIECHCIPLSANAPPLAEDKAHSLAVLPQAYAFVKAKIDAGTVTLVHCSSGKDRTGLFMAYFLAMSGYSVVDAIARVKAIRPIAFNADGWEVFVLEVLTG